MIYSATITSASLRLRESRIIADLLLQETTTATWNKAIFDQNVLQMGSVESIKRITRLLRARLEPLGEGLWKMVRDGGQTQATQAAFAATLKNSRLLGDFMDITIREQLALFAKKLEYHMWNEYIAGCRGRDPNMPQWSDNTVAKLRSTVFAILPEAGYLKDTRRLQLQSVFIDAQLAAYLRDRGEAYVLRCMEVTE